MQNRVLFKSIYGSHLYGTNTPSSDMDLKQIHMNPTDVLLTGKYSGGFNQNTNSKGKNTSEDVDFESKELRHFIKEALSGQTYAIDLLFTPDNLILERSPEWDDIIVNRDRLVSNNIKPFIGYVQSQAAKYSAKGEKIKELNAFLEAVEVLATKSSTTLGEIVQQIDISQFKYFEVKVKMHDTAPYEGDLGTRGKCNTIPASEITGDRVETYLFGPNCEFPMTRRFAEVYPVLLEKRKAYGKRAEEASLNNGVDLKAYYHALRIIWQLEDYMTTGRLEFPSPRVQHLKDIRAGKYNKGEIEDWISTEIERVTSLPNNLPDPDYEFWNDWLLIQYMKQAHRESRKFLRMKGLMK